ncbi:DUF4175 domain-containing protein [Hymenobacter lucidus]|uniref:DUF4175 domain-containing protein n=1 Tax=Hymenobacter lucidus TaxID=2880930 RepID=A0ABS8AVN5_9BACT|nr:DUF4175 domain-containing protein [Hymenobacter lucidus]MCB2409262.1 DUF4175 domain-containing protein [Hymenobacter lucidus]
MTSAVTTPPIASAEGISLLRQIRQAHRWQRTARLLLPTLAAAGLLLLGAYRLPQTQLLVLSVAVLGLGLAGWQLRNIWRQPLAAVARQLDRHFPTLEDSTGLLLQPTAGLNLLARLQQQHVAARLQRLRQDEPRPLLPVRFAAAWWLTTGLLAGVILLWFWQPGSSYSRNNPGVTMCFPTAPAKPGQVAPPTITTTHIRILPPAYTRRAPSAASAPSFRCPQGSRVQWVVEVSRAATAPQLEIGRQRLAFRPVPGHPLQFAIAHTFTASTLYRIRFAGQASDDYAVEVEPDRAPAIQIRTPKPYTLVEFGQKPEVAVQFALGDDYGLTSVRLVATVAQGQGEAVKFREVATDLSSSLRGQPTQATLTHRLRLLALGLTYGDEVYFYVQAWDNNRHTSRSDTYLVQWEDTTVDDSGSDMAMGVNVVPAYFRSQRQVIIDTEKLLVERRQLAPTGFSSRANDLGHDQKVLRLRYGKFLGEEFEESFGQSATRPPTADADHTEEPGHAETEELGHDHAAPATAADASPEAAAALLDPYVHHHDDSETADFLEPAVKAKLRGVLSQMWEAELRLRTARPAEALPYEYRALRLLKQVQQQTRLYVRKSGFDPPIIPEATSRLTGELAGATASRRQQTIAATSSQATIRAALQTLARLRQHAGKASPTEALALERASGAAAQAALRNPGRYLSAVRDLRQLTTEIRRGQVPCQSCLQQVAAALTDLLPPPTPAPGRPAGPGRVARRYFQELSQ